MFEQFPDLFTIKDLQTALRIGRNKAYQLVGNKEIKSLKIGKAILIPKSHVIDYIRRTCYNEATVDGCASLMEVTG